MFHKTDFMDIFLLLIARMATAETADNSREDDTHNIYYLFIASPIFWSCFGYKHHYKTIERPELAQDSDDKIEDI